MELKNIYTGMKKFVTEFTDCPASSVIQGWQNRMAMPKPPFVVMSIIEENGYSTNVHDYDTENQKTSVSRGVIVRFQLDCYGTESYAWASGLAIMVRDALGCDVLKPYGISPLYANEPRCLPTIFGENQYELRWSVEMFINYDSTIDIQEQSFTEAQLEKYFHALI